MVTRIFWVAVGTLPNSARASQCRGWGTLIPRRISEQYRIEGEGSERRAECGAGGRRSECRRAAIQRPRVRGGVLPPGSVGFAAERTQDEVPGREWPARIEGRSRPSGPDARGRPPATRSEPGSRTPTRSSTGLDSRAFIEGVTPELLRIAVTKLLVVTFINIKKPMVLSKFEQAHAPSLNQLFVCALQIFNAPFSK